MHAWPERAKNMAFWLFRVLSALRYRLSACHLAETTALSCGQRYHTTYIEKALTHRLRADSL